MDTQRQPDDRRPVTTQESRSNHERKRRKQKVSLSIDADLLATLKARGPLSPQVNDAIRKALSEPRT